MKIYGNDFIKIRTAMALMSLDYMKIPILILNIFLSKFIGQNLAYEMTDVLISIMSFLGSIFFLFVTRKVLPKWYLAFPLSILLFYSVIQTLTYYYFGIMLNDQIVTRSGILLVLFSAFPILVFLSLHNQPISTKLYMIFLSVMSIISIFTIHFGSLKILFGSTITVNYLLFGLTFIGICFLAKAITYKNSEKVLSPLTIEST